MYKHLLRKMPGRNIHPVFHTIHISLNYIPICEEEFIINFNAYRVLSSGARKKGALRSHHGAIAVEKYLKEVPEFVKNIKQVE